MADSTLTGTSSPSDSSVTAVSNNLGDFDDNILGNYNAATYHIKFFCNAEATFVASPSNPYGKQVAANRVVIAESGVTGYNIKSANFSSKVSPGTSNRNVITNEMKIVIAEPSGTSFLDAMYASVSDIGVANWQKAEYGVEISFRGYNEDGSLNNNLCSNFPNGGVWKWRVIILHVDADVGPAGAEYTLTCNLADDFALHPQVGRLKKNLQVSSYSTLKEFLDDFANKLNIQAKVMYAIQPSSTSSAGTASGGSLYTYTFNCLSFTDYSGNTVDPSTFTFANGDDAINSLRGKGFLTDDKAKGVANLKAGDLISDVITTIIGATVEGPKYAIKADGSSSDDRGDGGYRPSGFFRVYPQTANTGYDITTQNYIKNLTYNIKMYTSPRTTLRVAEVQNTDNGTQMITSVKAYNGLRKRYDYIFTGLNTEIIDFSTKFDFNWNASLPANLGYTNKMAQIEHHGKYNEEVAPDQISAKRQADLRQDAADAQAAQQSQLNVKNGSATTPIGGRGTSGVGAGSTTDAYAENLIDTRPSRNPFPISVLQSGIHLDQHAGTGVVGRYDRRRSIYAAIVSQLQSSNSFAKITMKIKGDPYWLGPDPASYYTIGTTPSGDASNNNSTTANPLSGGKLLPDYSYGDYYFALLYRFPYTSDENGAPLMKDDNIFSGLYGPTLIEHNFENGLFTQNITAYRATYPTPEQVRKVAPTNPGTDSQGQKIGATATAEDSRDGISGA